MSHTGSTGYDDERLLGDLGQALAGWRHLDLADILARARAVYTLRSLDAEPSRLVHESVLEVPDPRPGPCARTVVFESPVVSVEVEISVRFTGSSDPHARSAGTSRASRIIRRG